MPEVDHKPKPNPRLTMTSYLDDPAKLERVRLEAKREGISMGEFIRRATDSALAVGRNGHNGK